MTVNIALMKKAMLPVFYSIFIVSCIGDDPSMFVSAYMTRCCFKGDV